MIHRKNIDDARRQRCTLDGARQFERRQRRVVARAHDDRIARDQRGRDLAHQRVDREIERNQARDDADRLAMQHQVFVGRIARNDFAFDAARPFGVIARDLRGVDGFVGRVACAFARFHRQRRADGGGRFDDGIRETLHVRAALGGRKCAPKPLRGGGLIDGEQRLLARCVVNVARHLFRRGIQDGGDVIAGGLDETPVHEIPFWLHVRWCP